MDFRIAFCVCCLFVTGMKFEGYFDEPNRHTLLIGENATFAMRKSYREPTYTLTCVANDGKIDARCHGRGLTHNQNATIAILKFTNVDLKSNGLYVLKSSNNDTFLLNITVIPSICSEIIQRKSYGFVGMKYSCRVTDLVSTNVIWSENARSIGELNPDAYVKRTTSVTINRNERNNTYVDFVLSVDLSTVTKNHTLKYEFVYWYDGNRYVTEFKKNLLISRIYTINRLSHENLTLECNISSDTWYQKSNIDDTWVRLPVTSTLTLTNLQRYDSGSYKCKRDDFSNIIRLNVSSEICSKCIPSKPVKIKPPTNTLKIVVIVTCVIVILLINNIGCIFCLKWKKWRTVCIDNILRIR